MTSLSGKYIQIQNGQFSTFCLSYFCSGWNSNVFRKSFCSSRC